MQIPNVPTDNLYKFIAISGLVLIIFCISTAVYLQKDKFGNMIAIAVKYDVNIADSIKAMDSILYLEKILIIEKNDFKNKFAIPYDSIDLKTLNIKKDIKSELKHILSIELELRKLRSRIEYEKIRLHINNQALGTKVIPYELIYWCLLFFFLIGIGMCFFGFVMWYNRTQKYYDMKLKKDLPS